MENFFLLMDFCSLDPLDTTTLNRGGVRILNGMAHYVQYVVATYMDCFTYLQPKLNYLIKQQIYSPPQETQ
jgi:hypothetical protein